MKKLLMILGVCALTSCNGSFSAGYLLEGSWDNCTEPVDENAVACVTVTGEDTYVVDSSGSVI